MNDFSWLIVLLWAALGIPLSAQQQGASLREEPLCVENSPERRGEVGCSIVEDKVLPSTPKGPVFWHIDRFKSGEQAKAAVSATSVALEAHGAWWLMSVEGQTDDHHHGEHVAAIKLLPLPEAPKLSMRVLSA